MVFNSYPRTVLGCFRAGRRVLSEVLQAGWEGRLFPIHVWRIYFRCPWEGKPKYEARIVMLRALCVRCAPSLSLIELTFLSAIGFFPFDLHALDAVL